MFIIVLLFILALLMAIMLTKSVTIIHQSEKGIVERFGRFKETWDSGLRFLFPFADSLKAKVDLREQVIDIEPQSVITKDNVTVKVDAVIYYYVTDARAVTYEVANFFTAVTKLAQTNLRNVIGEMSLDETLTSRERINTSLRNTLDEATDKWGVKVTRVEVKEIEPPSDITDAMSKQMKAEREKRATILEAEAYKQKQILQAEGDRQHAILVAEGDKQSKILRAEGEAQAIENVSNAAEKFFVGNAQLLKQMEVTQASLQNNTKLVISDQSRLINVLGLTEALNGGRPGPRVQPNVEKIN